MQNIKKIIFLASLFTMILGMSALAEKAYTTADVLNVRSQPNMNAAVVGQYVQGTEVDVTGTSDVWYQIRYNSGYAYVHSDYVAIASAQAAPSVSMGNKVVEVAKQYIGTPYVYGGMSPSGFDCSGFVKYVYSQFGVNLNRVAQDQAKNGYGVSRDALQPGDIICFSSAPGGSYIGHVGIYVGNNQFIHSPRTGYTVTIESLNGHYGNRFNCARRIF